MVCLKDPYKILYILFFTSFTVSTSSPSLFFIAVFCSFSLFSVFVEISVGLDNLKCIKILCNVVYMLNLVAILLQSDGDLFT